MSGEGPCQGGFLGCPDHTGWGGEMLSACRQGCMSVLSLRLSPLQPFNFSAMASGENWGGGGLMGSAGGNKRPPGRCWLHADAGRRRRRREEPRLCRQHRGPGTPRLPRYLSPAEGRARGEMWRMQMRGCRG